MPDVPGKAEDDGNANIVDSANTTDEGEESNAEQGNNTIAETPDLPEEGTEPPASGDTILKASTPTSEHPTSNKSVTQEKRLTPTEAPATKALPLRELDTTKSFILPNFNHELPPFVSKKAAHNTAQTSTPVAIRDITKPVPQVRELDTTADKRKRLIHLLRELLEKDVRNGNQQP